MPSCPRCRAESLLPIPTAAAGRDAPLRCRSCRGIWVPRHALLFADLEDGAAAPASGPPPDSKAGLCPEGHALMRRARLEGELAFSLDRCPACGGTWFDAGEWHELATRHLLGSLDDLWDPLQQRRARAEHAQERWREELVERFGAAVLDDLDRLGDALADHPDAAQAIAYLEQRLRDRRPR